MEWLKNVGPITNQGENSQTLIRGSRDLITFVVMKLINHSYSFEEWNCDWSVS